jgi:hypothetical protein
MVGSSLIRVQHAANAKKGGTPKTAAGDIPASRCMGRSRGGLTTKIHAVVNANGNPFTPKLTEGQAHDGCSADDVRDSVGAGQTLLADRAYDSDALRKTLAAQGAKANVKPMPNRVREWKKAVLKILLGPFSAFFEPEDGNGMGGETGSQKPEAAGARFRLSR